jgi:hypothetical protein
VCCTGPLDSCGDAPCFNTEFERQAVMTIDFSDAPLAEIGQYAYRLRRPGDSADPPWSVGTLASYTLEIGEITTCYTLELLRFVDDEFLTPGERCVDRPNTVIPGIYTTDPQQIGSIVASCDDAPDGYETERCDALESLCMLDHVHCMRFTEECATGGVGGSGPGGTGAGGSDRGGTGSSGVAGSGANGGAGGDRPGSAGEGNGADDGAGDSGEGRTVITEGCGCTVPGQRGLRGSSFLAFGALAWWARRRKLRSRNASRVSDLAARLESASSP